MKDLILWIDHQNSDDSDVKVQINNFPDGQRSITILNPEILYGKVHVIIAKSIMVFRDIELIMSAISAISAHTQEYSLYSPYIMGLRSDRKFSNGGDFYLDQVIVPILKLMDCPIYTLDPHSPRQIYQALNPFALNEEFEKIGQKKLICPDESAKNRIIQMLDYTNGNEEFVKLLNGSIGYMKKQRIGDVVKQDPADELTFNILSGEDDILIVDDLFDGGASFVGLCESMRNTYGFKGKITIYVSHFIGSNISNIVKIKDLGVDILTTNSYSCPRSAKDMIKQIDVFSRDYISEVYSLI